MIYLVCDACYHVWRRKLSVLETAKNLVQNEGIRQKFQSTIIYCWMTPNCQIMRGLRETASFTCVQVCFKQKLPRTFATYADKAELWVTTDRLEKTLRDNCFIALQ